MKNRNPGNPKRSTEANERKTQERIAQYHGVSDLLRTWEQQPESVQADNHEYIIYLRAKVRMVRNYLLHRSDAKIRI